MKTDKELLELAAKAAGVTLTYNIFGCSPNADREINNWDPLNDADDNHRLMVDLRISIQNIFPNYIVAEKGVIVSSQPRGTDDHAATRRAVVEVAAAIGEKMP